MALPLNDPLPADAFRAITASTVTRFELEGHNRFSHRSGFYIGDAIIPESDVASRISIYHFKKT
jgi:hypothetical protein